jgi:hypothetical protein
MGLDSPRSLGRCVAIGFGLRPKMAWGDEGLQMACQEFNQAGFGLQRGFVRGEVVRGGIRTGQTPTPG